jgi:hypothetical protein
MSLDVYLIGEPEEVECFCTCGNKHTKTESACFYSSNITHNLGEMALEAGIYEHLWRPEEIEITKANQLVEPLSKGLSLMKSDPKRFKKFTSKNGWGTYKDFIPWIEDYIEACVKYPNANVSVSR